MFYHPKMLSGLTASDRTANAEVRFNDGFQPLPDARPERDRALHRTLVPVDGSEEADRAIEYVDSLAQQGLTTEIHLLNVQPLVMRGDFAFDDLVQAEETARLAAAQQVMQRARARLPAGVPVKVAVRFGRTAHAIAGYAKEHGITAIAMATRTSRSLRNLFRKSVAIDVVRRVDVPVTLLKPIVAADERQPDR
jgi:nucleotide-binding universal stress UspA family protein